MKALFTILTFGLLQWATAAEFHVAPTGNDANPGTRQKPFATLERARDAARQAKDSTVILAEGTYRLTKTFLLDERDSHTTYRGVNARVTGSIAIPASAVKPVTDPAILERLLPEVRGKVVEVDLHALGITDFGAIGPRGFGRPSLLAPVELFVDNEPLTLSRWPKLGEPGVPIGKVLDSGTNNLSRGERPHGGTFEFKTDRPARWAHSGDVWITGFFFNGYADDTLQVKSFDLAKKTLTTVQRHGYGFNSGKPWNRWTALNLIEEIAQPGEYATNPKTGKFYFLPPKVNDVDKRQIEASVMQEPLVSIEGATGVVFDGVNFECSRGIGVTIEGGARNRIQNATLRNLGMLAVRVGGAKSDPGKGHGIVNCRIFDIGAGAIVLGGGDRKNLIAAGNFVENCEIHHFNRWERTYRGAVNISGVGNIIRHCLIHDCPGVAILLAGNEHLIEYNEIYHAIMEGDDMGAFYMGRNPTERGNVIRYNYWHDLAPAHSTHCLYFDDSGGDGAKVYGNVFRKAGSLSTININGGSDIIVTNNIFIDCKKPIRMGGGGNVWRTRDGRFESIIKATGCDKSPWRERYPELLTYLADRPTMPRGNLFATNLLVNCNATPVTGIEIRDNFSVTNNPGMKGIGIPGFEPIPFDKIGLKNSPQPTVK